MHEFTINSVIRGYHKYQRVWSAPIDGRDLQCEREPGNPMDTSAVAILDHSSTSDSAGSTITVGHVPRLISMVCSIFIRRGGTIVCVVTGPRQYSSDLPQGGSCCYIFRTKDCALKEKAKKVAQEIYSVLSVSHDANGNYVDGPHAAGAVGNDQRLH